MSTLSKRLVVRLPEDMDAWIGEQAALEGLDNATWVRSVLTRMRNGRLSVSVSAVDVVNRAVRTVGHEAETVAADEPPEELAEYGPDIEEKQYAPRVDIDAMVAEAVGAAEEQGLTEPREIEQQPIAAGGVRPVFRRPPPFSATTQPHWLEK